MLFAHFLRLRENKRGYIRFRPRSCLPARLNIRVTRHTSSRKTSRIYPCPWINCAGRAIIIYNTFKRGTKIHAKVKKLRQRSQCDLIKYEILRPSRTIPLVQFLRWDFVAIFLNNDAKISNEIIIRFEARGREREK